MKYLCLLLCLVAFSGIGNESKADFIVANWTFETYNGGSTQGPNSPNLRAEAGTQAGSAVASGTHANVSTIWSNPVGNGSIESFSSAQWGIGDFYQFQFSSVGLSGINLSFDQARSGAGPEFFKVQWSADGASFSDLSGGAYTVLINGTPGPGTWSSTGSRNAAYTSNFDLTAVTGLNNLSSAYIRLTATSAPGNVNGASRVDNVSISAVPEPGTGVLIGLGLLAFSLSSRRNRVKPGVDSLRTKSSRSKAATAI